MNYNYFDNEENLSKLLTDCNDIFTMIDEYAQQFMQGILVTSSDYKDVLNKLTGAYMYLEPLYTLSVSQKENRELVFYVKSKRELEAKSEKVVATSLEKESSASVEVYRRVRSILEGYVESCSKGIITCQTQLRKIEGDSRFKPVEEA